MQMWSIKGPFYIFIITVSTYDEPKSKKKFSYYKLKEQATERKKDKKRKEKKCRCMMPVRIKHEK